jgi:hypothetical protein
MPSITIGEVGTDIVVRIYEGSSPKDVSSASQKRLYLTAPDKTVLEKTAAFFTDGTDGRIVYVTEAGDLDQVGTWFVRAYISLVGWSGYSSSGKFTVSL